MSKFLNTLRWRLPLSYGAIALLATLSLGGILLFALDRYYALQEQRYLLSNAQAFGSIVESYSAADLESPLFQTQVATLASLIQAQIQIYDPNGALIADSGLPTENDIATTLSLRVEGAGSAQEFSQTTQGDADNQQVTSSLAVEEGVTRVETITTIRQSGINDFVTPLSILETPSSFGLGGSDPNVRSNQVFVYEVVSFPGELLGTIRLSQGPAFGRAILITVGWGVGLAGLVAIGLATFVGWLVSRRLSAPISHLADVSNQMASGNLTARAEVQRQDEIGELALAFNGMSDQLAGMIGTLLHFVADAAHEIRTPLTALRTNLDLALTNEDNGRYLQAAHAQLQRMQSLTDDLLQLSRLENGVVQIEKRPFDLNMILAGQIERYAAQAEQAELHFGPTLTQTAVMVHGNAAALLRAVDNLVDNSFKFTPAGGQVWLSLDIEGETAVVTVEDSGLGLAEDSHRLFSRFYRGRNVSDFPGSGLGLAITKTIIDAHRGHITPHKQPGGTKMVMRIPLINRHR
ncbi:MAG: HAMP domain-containing sensor histidine kinase [Chloroflexota bacterium]